MNSGKVLAEGTPKELINSEMVRNAYLGSMFKGDEFDEPTDNDTPQAQSEREALDA